MSTQDEVAEEALEFDRPVMAPEISGGQLQYTNLGGQFGQYIGTQVNKTYNPVGGSRKPQKPGEFQVACLITVYEKKPISHSSRVFEGCYHSDVTGDRLAAIKITPAEEKNYREAKIYFKVPYHKNIVERFATDTFSFRGLPSIFIAMERCDCNLYDHIKSEVREEKPFDAEKYTWISYQILVALEFLHSHNVVHGDLKPSNVLLIVDGYIVKLTDFGLSRSVTPGSTSTQLTSPQGGTTGWQAPEILNGSAQISFKSDIFPCGLTLFFTWSHGKHAYGNETVSLNHYIVKGIKRDLGGMLIPFVSDAKALLESTLQQNPTGRPTIKEILQSRIFRRYGSQENRMDETDLAAVFDRALGQVNQPPDVGNHDDSAPLRVMTTRQFEDALRSFIARNRQQLNRMTDLPTSPTSPGPSASVTTTQQGATPWYTTRSTSFSTTPKSHDTRPARAESDATNPKNVVETTTSPLQGSKRIPSQQPVSTAPLALEGTPLCRGGCTTLLMYAFGEECLPQITAQIFRDSAYRGKGEFMKIDFDSKPAMIQERLSNIPTCDGAITTIAVAYWDATTPLSHALDENNLRKFLQTKGMFGDDLQQRIRNIRNSLAVFTFQPLSNIVNNSAKVAINILLDRNGGDGKLQSVTCPKGKVANKVVFKGDRVFIDDYVQSYDVMKCIRISLRREDGIEYCHHHY